MRTVKAEHVLEAPLDTVLQWVRLFMRSLDVPFCSFPRRPRLYLIERRDSDIVLSEYDIPAHHMSGPTHPRHYQSQCTRAVPLLSFLSDPQGRGTVMQEYDVHWLEEMQERSEYLNGVYQAKDSIYSNWEIRDQLVRTETVTEFAHKVAAFQHKLTARLLERFTGSAESDTDEVVREATTEQSLPRWFPIQPAYQEKWWKSYRVIKKTEKEFSRAYSRGDTEKPKPSRDDLRDALAETWGKRPDVTTVSRIKRAAREGIFRRIGFTD